MSTTRPRAVRYVCYLCPSLRNRLGTVLTSTQEGITHAFVVEFASASDRDYYIEKDPAHLKFVSTLDGVVEKVQVIDYTNGVF